MEQSPSREAKRSLANQEILSILWNLKDHYHIHKRPPSVPIQSQCNPNNASHLILILSSHLCLGLSHSLCSRGSPPKPCMHLSCPQYIPHMLTISQFLISSPKQYLVRSTDHKVPLLHFPVTSSLLGTSIFLSTPFLNTLSLCTSLNVTDHASHPYETTGHITVLYILIFISLNSKLQDKRLCRLIASIP